MFDRVDIAFEAGLFANRSKRASQNRWVDGNLVRFNDGPPAQIGGWRSLDTTGATLTGKPRSIIAWRPLTQIVRYGAIGTHSNLYTFDGGKFVDITPSGFTAGTADDLPGNGWGMGTFGTSTYGTPRATVTGTTIKGGNWTFDMFGSLLIACYRTTGDIYKFDSETDSQAALVATAPTADAIVVSDERHLFALGADGDPKLVWWSDREDYTDFVLATPGTRAGTFDMNNTSPFQCGVRVRGTVLALTKTEAFAFTPLGNAAVYSRDRLATNCGTCGPHSVAVITSEEAEMAVWMGRSAFFIFDGLLRELPCDLHDYVYNDINMVQRAKFWAQSVAEFGEVWFHYCSADSLECDRAVIYCYRNGAWSKATISRLAGIDRGIFDYPLMLDGTPMIYEHETGTSADGAVMDSFVTSHPLQFGSGYSHIEADAFWPDLQENSGSVDVTFTCRDFPGDTPVTHGPYTCDTATEKAELAIDARLVQLTIAGASGHWELGLPAASIQPGGGR